MGFLRSSIFLSFLFTFSSFSLRDSSCKMMSQWLLWHRAIHLASITPGYTILPQYIFSTSSKSADWGFSLLPIIIASGIQRSMINNCSHNCPSLFDIDYATATWIKEIFLSNRMPTSASKSSTINIVNYIQTISTTPSIYFKYFFIENIYLFANSIIVITFQ